MSYCLFNNMWPLRGYLNYNYNFKNNEYLTVSAFRISRVERLPYCLLTSIDHELYCNTILGSIKQI